MRNSVKNREDLLVLISEKGGEQARDNGFSYFAHRINEGFKNTYYVCGRNNIDSDKLKPYSKNVIIKDSLKHRWLFYKADYLVLNDGYMDVFPSFKKKPLSRGWSPIIYLQHGIISYKKVHFYKGHYNGRIRYFHTSLSSEYKIVKDVLQPQKDIKQTYNIILKHKIFYLRSYFDRNDLRGFYRYILSNYYNDRRSVDSSDLQILKRLITNIGFLSCRLVNSGLSRHENLQYIRKTNQNMLFFFTWRDDWTIKGKENTFLSLVKKIKDSTRIMEYADNHKLKVVFYLHEKILYLQREVEEIFEGNIGFVGQNDFNVVLKDTALCITDYSSVSFEFNLLNIPVIFLQFDYDFYKHERGHFMNSPNDFLGVTVRTIDELENIFSFENFDKALTLKARRNRSIVRQDYPNFGKSNYLIDKLLEKKQNHIVYFCYNLYGVGGTVQTVINQANYLVSIGYMVTVISLRRTEAIPKLNLDPSVRLEYLNDARSKGKFRNKYENLLSKFKSRLFKKTEDLYSGLSILTDLKLILILRTLRNCTLVGTFPGLCVNIIKYSHNSNVVMAQEHKEFSSHSDEIQQSILRTYRKAHKVIALTRFQKEEYINNGIFNVTNIPNGIEDKLSMIKGCSNILSPKRIVSFGRLVEIKQFNLLIESFALIAKKYPDWNLDIYGDGDKKESLLKMIADYDLSEQVRICEPTSLVYEEIYASSFCALTAFKEPFGMVYIESFSMGKPVISYDIGYGPKEFLKDGYNSLISPCFDTVDFSRKMEMLMNDETLLKKLGEGARRTYIDHYEISKVMKSFINECSK